MTRKSKCIPNVVLFSKALVEWPFGTYTLVKPNAGYPSGWLEGWRYQDNEDHNNKNKMSYGHHFYGEYTRHKKKHFLLYCSYIIQVTRKQKIYILRIQYLVNTSSLVIFLWLLTGSFGRNLKFYYCTRDPNIFSGRRYWPSGNYCILKQGTSCPKGDYLEITIQNNKPLPMIL